jgi:hypothetical protein
MKAKLPLALIAIALGAALAAANGSSVSAQPVASITLPPPGGAVQLYPWCNNVSLTFDNGTPSETVVQAVTPSETVQAMWRHNAALNKFEGFSPAAPQASDLLTVDFLDPVWLCLAGGPAPAPTAAPPPPPPPPPAAPTATPTGPPAADLTPIVFESGDGKDRRFHIDTSRFRADWKASLSEVEDSGSMLAFRVLFRTLDPSANLDFCICAEMSHDTGVWNGTCDCEGGPGDFEFEVTGTGLEWWRIEITPLRD